jgi:hypothetical protein
MHVNNSTIQQGDFTDVWNNDIQANTRKQVNANLLNTQDKVVNVWQNKKAEVTAIESTKTVEATEQLDQTQETVTNVQIADSGKTELTPAQKSLIEAEVASIMQRYEAELAKGANADSNKLYWMALSIASYLMHLSGRNDQEYVLEMAVRVREHVKDVQGTFNSTWGTILTIASAVISIVGGAMALSPLYGSSLFSLAASTTRTLANAAQPICTIGSAVGGFGKLVDEKQAGQRTFFQHVLEEAKERRSTRKHSHEQSQGQTSGHNRAIEDLVRSLHQAIQHMFSSAA